MRKLGTLISLALVALVAMAFGQGLVIEALDRNGQLVFNELPTATVYRVEWATNLMPAAWSSNAPGIMDIPATGEGSRTVSVTELSCLYRVLATVTNAESESLPPPPAGMVLIPGGENSGTNPLGTSSVGWESHDACTYPATYSLSVGSFYMDQYEVTNDEMVDVLNWAYGQGKLIVSASSVSNAQGDSQELLDLDDTDCRIAWSGSQFVIKPEKGSGYPCVEVAWYGAAAYCNYRTLKEAGGLTPCYDLDTWVCNLSATGYRLPTDDEWEYAARGGVESKRYPWGGNTIDAHQANYYGVSWLDYDLSDPGAHEVYGTGEYPQTSPVGSFEAGKNAYGLYDMAGNVQEMCTDLPACYDGTGRAIRGGIWQSLANMCRVGQRGATALWVAHSYYGFRTVLVPSQ